MTFRPSLLAGLFFLSGCSVAFDGAEGAPLPNVDLDGVKPAAMNGAIDSANSYSNVGVMVAEFDGTKYPICSGTLIAPRVYLTASHCTIGLTEAWVAFDVAYSSSSKLFHGTPVTHPQYGSGGQNDAHDIAVILLDLTPHGISPANLPARGAFDSVAKDQQFTAVGYGVYSRTVGGGEPDFLFDATRRIATSTHNSTNKTWLRLSQNPATGNGGTCYGDSGGPNFLGTTDVIAGLTITGDTACRSTNVIYRLDADSARDFLGQYVTLP